jgi:hypothetical protein
VRARSDRERPDWLSVATTIAMLVALAAVVLGITAQIMQSWPLTVVSIAIFALALVALGVGGYLIARRDGTSAARALWETTKSAINSLLDWG